MNARHTKYRAIYFWDDYNIYRNFVLRFRAASDFFFFLTLGFSKCSCFLASARTPAFWQVRLKRRRALSRVSFLPTLTSANEFSLPSAEAQIKFLRQQIRYNPHRKNTTLRYYITAPTGSQLAWGPLQRSTGQHVVMYMED